jgi:hypothetical protein
MPFPSSTGSQSFTLEAALNLAQGTAANIKARTQSLSTACAAGNVAAQTILDVMTMLADSRLNLTKCAALSGLAAYAQAQIGDASIATEFNTMTSALDAVISWTIANFPKDSTNTFLMITSFTADNTGRTQQRTFTSAQLVGLKTLLDALVATID